MELDAIACLHFSSVLSSPKEVKISLGAFISSHYRFTLCVCVSVCVRQTAGIRSECLVWHVNKLCGADGHQRDPSRQIKGERGSSCFRSLVHSVNSVSASTSHQHKHTHTDTVTLRECVTERWEAGEGEWDHYLGGSRDDHRPLCVRLVAFPVCNIVFILKWLWREKKGRKQSDSLGEELE